MVTISEIRGVYFRFEDSLPDPVLAVGRAMDALEDFPEFKRCVWVTRFEDGNPVEFDPLPGLIYQDQGKTLLTVKQDFCEHLIHFSYPWSIEEKDINSAPVRTLLRKAYEKTNPSKVTDYMGKEISLD